MKYMTLFTSFLTIGLNSLYAFSLGNFLSLDLSCDRCIYNKQELSCVGHVQLEAPPLKMNGQRLCWQEERQLLCLDGAFNGSLDGFDGSLDGALARVEYAPEAETLFTLNAEHMTLTCNHEKHPTHMEAERRIDCHFRTAMHSKVYALHAQGDRLQVHVQEHTNGEPSTYQISLESTKDSKSTATPCHVEIEQGFQGDAKSFQYDTASLQGEAHELQGVLDLDLEGKIGRLEIKADHLTWDGTQLRLILEGNILLSLYEDQEAGSRPFCTLTASNRLICACQSLPRLCCHKVQIEGPMQLNHTVWGTLTGSGVLLMDCLKNKVIARGLPGSTGEIPLENQVCLETTQGKIQGDRLALDLYREAVQGFSLHAQGLVGIEGLQGQYALAHEMHYDTRSHQGELLGSHSQRVLFWEPRYDVRLSAPSCRFTLHDPETGKIKVQGNGDVRMTFFDMERKKIQTRFSGYERK